MMGQDVRKIRTEAPPQQHVTALSGHASSHNWGVPAHRPSVPRYVTGGLDQLVEQGFVEHETPAGKRNVRKEFKKQKSSHYKPPVLQHNYCSAYLSNINAVQQMD